ncbi:hypothetical protein [Companilactobacillus muriivasis]|uniref:hypothetical protein n=1 Tax=Companilactobacillus muriivasis TaxID=3081444 RepID=UPI0030C6D663
MSWALDVGFIQQSTHHSQTLEHMILIVDELQKSALQSSRSKIGYVLSRIQLIEYVPQA